MRFLTQLYPSCGQVQSEIASANTEDDDDDEEDDEDDDDENLEEQVRSPIKFGFPDISAWQAGRCPRALR